MTSKGTSFARDFAPARRLALLRAVILVVAALGVYWNSRSTPFIFDDVLAVERNPTIRQLWPPGGVLNPPVDGSGVSGRPMANLSLALTYAIGGLDVRFYHWGNILLHLASALALWGVLRRTLRNWNRLPEDDSEALAFAAALLWTVHPLLTETVVCVVQRNEILGSFFYLLTLYGFIRGCEGADEKSRDSREGTRQGGARWFGFSLAACLVGITAKEIVATAPLVVLLYDRTFVAGTFQRAWRSHKTFYLALITTWLPLAWLVVHNARRGGTVGFGLSVSSWDYLLTQCRALVLYLRLSLWPHPLVVDYGWPVVRSIGEVWWQGALVLALLALTGLALVRKPVIGFVAACFFIILAPSSSFVPLITQTIAEHRMYLPLAAVIVMILGAGYAVAGRASLHVALAVAAGLGILTVRRNRDYRSELAIWTRTIADCPGNARAYGNLGRAYLQLGRWEDAIAACQQELALAPNYNGDARVNIGRALTELGRPAEAIPYFEAGLRLRPDSFDVHNNYGVALAALGRWPEAVGQYESALRLNPAFPELHNNLANALAKVGRWSDALVHYAEAVKLAPEFAEAETNWARALAEHDRLADALPHFRRALELQGNAATQLDLANALSAAGRTDEAVPCYEAALRLQPDDGALHCSLGNALARLDRFAEAIDHYRTTVRLRPDLVDAQHNLAAALMHEGQVEAALPYFEATVRLLPGSAEAHHELALVLDELSRRAEAAAQEEEALRLQPDFPEAREHLEWLRHP